MTDQPSFARLVSLAAHDLRTPLATVSGFAKTLTRLETLDEQPARYVGMIEAASDQLAELLDDLGLAARIEDGRYEPVLRELDSLELARTACERLGEDRVTASGSGGAVRVDPEATQRAVVALARCALRHGGLERIDVVATGTELSISPIVQSAAPVVLGDDLRDLGAAVAVRLVRAEGGTIELDGETLRVSLPAAE